MSVADWPPELANDETLPTPEIRDHWEGPRTYAEDFYAGGDALPAGADVTPSHLTPRDDDKPFIPGVTSAPQEPSGSTADIDIVDVDDLYADVAETSAADLQEQQQPQDVSIDGGAVQEHSAERLPSPPSATLSKDVNWNWPPAFPGKIATGSGHLADGPPEIISISDDEDEDDEAPSPSDAAVATEAAPPNSSVMDFYDNDFDLGSVEPPHSSSAMYGAFEPVNEDAMDFGDLPPSRSEALTFDDYAEPSFSAIEHKEEKVRGEDEGIPLTASKDDDIASTHEDEIPFSAADYLVDEVVSEEEHSQVRLIASCYYCP